MPTNVIGDECMQNKVIKTIELVALSHLEEGFAQNIQQSQGRAQAYLVIQLAAKSKANNMPAHFHENHAQQISSFEQLPDICTILAPHAVNCNVLWLRLYLQDS